MKTVFISSIQRDFGDVREEAAKGVLSLRMHPVMAETAGASSASPQRALLDEVRDSDVFLLLLGPRYGDAGSSGDSPTEDEFNEAVRLGKPIFVLKQNVALEPAQEEFLNRTRGSWEQGRLSGSFDDSRDVGYAVVQALSGAARGAATDPGAAHRARAQAEDLAREGESRNQTASGSKARFIAVPVGEPTLLDALALDDGSLGDDLAMLARQARLVSNAMAVELATDSEGVRFTAKDARAYETLTFVVSATGIVIAEGPVGGDSQHFGSSEVSSARLTEFVESAQQFALRAWERIDPGHDVRQVAVAVAIPEAQHKVFTTAPLGNSMSYSMRLPPTVVAPEPPRLCQREELGTEQATQRLVAEVKRKFADGDAVRP